MLRDNSITVHMSHRVHRSGSFVSVRARKREDDEDGRTSRVKEEDTCARAMAVEEEEEEEEKGRRKAGGGGEEEREKIGGGKDGLSLSVAAHGCAGIVRHLRYEKNDEFINDGVIKSVADEKNAIAKCRERTHVFPSFKLNCIY